MTDSLVTIEKEGELVNIPAAELRVGDLVILQAGEIVPADLQLVETRSLEVDEFELTGELLPVLKTVGDGLLYQGSQVLRGMGKGRVTATGSQTEYGKILKQDWEVDVPRRIRVFPAGSLFLAGLFLPALLARLAWFHPPLGEAALYLFGLGLLLVLQNDELLQRLLVDREKKRLEGTQLQIRDLRALERLAEVDIFCLDKTGVLTTRAMQVRRLYFGDGVTLLAGQGSLFETVSLACALCHDVQFYNKVEQANPIDRALIAFATKHGQDVKQLLAQYRRVYDLPFDSENRYMACGFEGDSGEILYFAKGDPEVILKLCGSYLTETGAEPRADSAFGNRIRLALEEISRQGDTALALAVQTGQPGVPPGAYTFLCLLQLENSLQKDAEEVVSGIKKRGIRPLMLTGDRPQTAEKVAAACGLTSAPQASLTGRLMERMAASEIARQAAYCPVFARLNPSQKAYLIRLLQQKGHRVAMVGDGANDGLALRVADVGISFAQESSPLAQRRSHILIPDLGAVLRLFESARWIKNTARRLKILRVILITATLVGVYLWLYVLLTGQG